MKINKKRFVPIKRRILYLFLFLFAASIVLIWAVNSFFLEKYYLKEKRNSLKNLYSEICVDVNAKLLDSPYFSETMYRYVQNNNTSIVIINSLFEPIMYFSNEQLNDILVELQNNVWGYGEFIEIYEKNDDYILVRKADRSSDYEYIEMWGTLPNQSFFMLRTTVESIKESTRITNTFLLLIGGIVIVMSAVIILLFTRQITNPVLELADVSKKIADMDFSAKYKGKYNSEIGLLGANINSLSYNLEKTLSQLKTANLELMADNEKKTRVDEMRKEFLSNVSHELKTPIALIQGYAEGLKEEVNEAEERDYYCDVIIDEAVKMNNMVKKLLNLNRLEFGGLHITLERIDICQLIRNVVSSLEILYKNDIRVTYPSGEFYAWTDEYMTEEVFTNYFTNACHYCESPKEKRIDVSLEMIENKVKILVFNTGKNIPEECFGRLWEKFYKIDKARTREYGGSGVGLSIVKAICEALNQEYGVYNVEDGVVFWFTVDAIGSLPTE